MAASVAATWAWFVVEPDGRAGGRGGTGGRGSRSHDRLGQDELGDLPVLGQPDVPIRPGRDPPRRRDWDLDDHPARGDPADPGHRAGLGEVEIAVGPGRDRPGELSFVGSGNSVMTPLVVIRPMNVVPVK